MKNLTKHFTVITKSAGETRPILKGIHYNHTVDTLEATDSHRLLSWNAHYEGTTSHVTDPLTLQRIEGHYPECERLIPQQHMTNFKVNQITTNLLKMIAPFKKELIQLLYTDNALIIKQENGNVITELTLSNTIKPESSQMFINGTYFYDVLAFLVDYATTYKNYPDVSVFFTFTSSYRPITFSNEDFAYLITPVRAHHEKYTA